MRRSVKQLRRDRVVASDGPAGSVRDVVFEDRRWQVRYFVVHTGGWLSGPLVLIAPESIDAQGSGDGVLRVDLTRERLANAPNAETDPPVWRQMQLAQAVRFGYPYYWSELGLWGAVAGRDSQADAERAAHALLARADPHLRSCAALIGCSVEARDGALGEIDDFVVNERGWVISDVVVDTRRWWPGGRVRIAPALVAGIDWGARKLHLVLTADQAKATARA